LTAFILDTKNNPGVRVLRLEEKLGIHASPTGQVALENVEIPVEDKLGKENKGFAIILHGLSVSRNGIGAQACGIADAAYRKAVEYSSQRKQFNTPLSNFQNTQFKIADMAMKIGIARNYYIYSTRLKDMGKEFFKESSIAKLYGSEMAQEVTWQAIQMLGGYGYVREYDVERYYRDARITTIYEGTSEVQRLIISRNEISKYGQKTN
jgi:alkylation response protein AidB-like acyl-CoA dehydrogenase